MKTKAFMLTTAFVVLAAAGATAGAAPQAAPETVTLCHKPATPAQQTLTLPSAAAPGHLGHGDTLGACGGGGELCGPPPPAPPNPDPTVPSGYEGPPSSATVTLEGASETGFLAVGTPFTFRLSCPTLDPTPSGLTVYDNTNPIPDTNLTLTSNSITLPGLSSGRHDIFVAARDTYGAPIIANVVLWVGSTSIPVLVLSESGSAVSGATVRLTLGDDDRVGATLTTNTSGQATFTNLPNRSYNIVATTPDNRIGFKPHSFIDGAAVIRLRGFGTPSLIDNNDFSLGTQGWEIGNEQVTIIPHIEGSPGGFVAAVVGPEATAAPGQAPLRTIEASQRAESAMARTPLTVGLALPGVAPDFDLQLATLGEGPRTISRTFNVEPGYAAVRVRYRFVTSEVPGGYFGTEFNDFYNVSIRSQNAGGALNAGNSMNNLGLAAFDPGGATGWYEAELPVDANGDSVQVDLSVANVADGLFDSWLVADAVKVTSLRIESVQLFDIDNAGLDFISAASHPYFNGNVRFHGTITLRGPADASLSTLTLRIKRGGTTIGSGTIPSGLQSTLLTTFGSDQTIRVTSPQLLFEVPSSTLGAGHNTNENLSLQIFAATAAGDFVERDVLTKPRLTRYNNSNRYGGRDENRGGDDWVKPGVRAVIGQVGGAEWGDFSNMHGGSFAPDHSSHRTGNSADGWFNGYNNRDAVVAQRLINIINQFGRRIRLCYVTFTSAFSSAIANVTLNDGRAATDVFTDYTNHDTHFHFEVTDN